MEHQGKNLNKYEKANKNKGISLKDPTGKYCQTIDLLQKETGAKDRSDAIRKAVDNYGIWREEVRRWREERQQRETSAKRMRQAKALLIITAVIQVTIAVFQVLAIF